MILENMSKFNFKSQICTDKNQSERLLALGLKKETADCYWFYCDIAKEWKCTILSSTQVFKDYPTTIIPAWSLGRLIEMALKDVLICGISFTFNEDAYEKVIGIIEYQIEGGYFNREYLV